MQRQRLRDIRAPVAAVDVLWRERRAQVVVRVEAAPRVRGAGTCACAGMRDGVRVRVYARRRGRECERRRVLVHVERVRDEPLEVVDGECGCACVAVGVRERERGAAQAAHGGRVSAMSVLRVAHGSRGQEMGRRRRRQQREKGGGGEERERRYGGRRKGLRGQEKGDGGQFILVT